MWTFTRNGIISILRVLQGAPTKFWLQNLGILMLNHPKLVEQLIIRYITHYE